MEFVGAIKREINDTKKIIRKKIKKFNEKKPKKSMRFLLTYRCNYNCSYCCQKEERNLSKNDCSLDASDEVIDGFIKYIKETKDKCSVELIGGEIFLHPRAFEVIEAILERNHHLVITTNFSLPIDMYQKVLELSKKHSYIWFGLSLHLEQTNLETFFEKLRKLDLLVKGKCHINYSVQSVLTEENFETLKNADEILQNQFQHKLEYQNLITNKGLVTYNNEIENYMKKIDSKHPDFTRKTEPGYLKLYGTKCYAGCKWISIDSDGKIYRCFDDQKGLSALGNIKSGKIKYFKGAKPCLSDTCSCCIFYRENYTKFGNKNYLKILYYWLRYDLLYRLKSKK